MALTYDVDIPAGQTGAVDQALAAFRNPATAEALRGADDRVRAVFREAGFGFLPSGGTLPTGTHDKTQSAAFDAAMARLLDARDADDLDDLGDADWNGFDRGAFLFTALRSVPVNPATAPPSDPAAGPGAKADAAPATGLLDAHIPMRYILIGMLLIGIVVYEVFFVPPGTDSLIDVLRRVLSFEPQTM